MTDIPKPWEISDGLPYATLERKNGIVTIATLVGRDNLYLVQATGHEDQTVEGHDAAHTLAQKLAEELD